MISPLPAGRYVRKLRAALMGDWKRATGLGEAAPSGSCPVGAAANNTHEGKQTMEDPLAPARGIIHALGFSLILWAIIATVIWLIIR